MGGVGMDDEEREFGGNLVSIIRGMRPPTVA
jgi:hypothetical protein